MTTKTDIKKILSKGLTGKEAGRLILQDNWLVDHAKEGFLSDRDIQSIKSSLKTTEDIQVYNSYIEAYRLIDYTLKDAHIVALTLHKRIYALNSLISMYFFDSGFPAHLYPGRPEIMTEKQYKETLAKEREERLKTIDPLREDLQFIAETATEDEDTPEDEYILDWLEREKPDLWKKIVAELLDLLKTGKLKPVSPTGKSKEKLELIWDQIRDLQDQQSVNNLSRDELLDKFREDGYLVSPEDEERHDILQKLWKEEKRIIQDLYLQRKDVLSQEDLVSLMERLLDGSISEEDKTQLLEYSLCSVEDYYQAGIEEYKEFVDNTRLRDSGIAILIDPRPSLVDEKGYYKQPHTWEESLSDPTKPDDTEETFKNGISQAKDEAKILLGVLSIMEAVSEAIGGIDFTEDIREWIQETKDLITEYNRARVRARYIEDIPDSLRSAILPLGLKGLRPSAKTIKYLKERISLGLGSRWWDEAKKAIFSDFKEKEAEDDKED